MAKLNNRQHEAVHYIDGPCLVLAGAGSGKTSVITRKIAYLIESCDMPAKHIAAVTFTNKAAREMKERVGQLVKGKNSRGLIVSTFHNLGLNLLRKELKNLPLKDGFSIFDAEDSRSLMKELMLRDGDADGDLLDIAQHQISRWKNDMLLPAAALSRAASEGEASIARLYEHYDTALRAYNAVDFDDLILMPVVLLRDNRDVLERWQKKIRYLLVDEYQDTNSSQYELVRTIVGGRAGLTVVGDDDQSIYAWRGAQPENMALLQNDFPNLNVIKLEQNYRSTARVLKCANHLIANNPHVFDKALWSDMGLGEPIKVIRCANEDAEAERVATEIFSQHHSRSARFKEFAILYRGNFQSRLVELKLQQMQIPYSINGGSSFFGKTEVKDLIAYLRLLVNPEDDNAFLRVVNTPRRQIGTSTLQTLGQYASDRGISMLPACDELGLQSRIPEKNLVRLRQFAGWIEKVSEHCRSATPLAAVREMLDEMDYRGWLEQNSSSVRMAEKRWENIEYLLTSIQTTMEKSDEDDEDKLAGALSKLMLRDLLERQSEEEDDLDQVQMMTLHAAKGLEFPYVFMIGMEEELLPHRTSIEEGNIEEERRLTYVGITRAKKVLHMTLANKRKQYGEIMETTPSRFLEELPAEDVEREGFGSDSPQVNQDRGRQTLDSLLNSL